MRISTWITSLYICALISVNKVVGEAEVELYGDTFTLYCGGSSQPGDWFHNGDSTGVSRYEYTITNADFSHDGEYQCKRGGVDVLGSPLEVNVYGRGDIIPLNCNSMSNGVCVRNVMRGQPVTLCANFTTIPPVIPEGKRVSNLASSDWYFKNGEGININLYYCTNSSCTPNLSVDHSPYTNASISCLTINNVQENHQYTLYASFEPHGSQSVIFNVTPVDSSTSSTSTSLSLSTLPTSNTITSSIPNSTTVNTGPLDVSEPSPGPPIPAIVIPIIVVLIIVIVVVVVILAAVFKLRKRKRFPLSTLNGSKLRNSQVTLQSPDILPSKLHSGNHINRPHLLPVNGHVSSGDGFTGTPGSQHCLLPPSPGNPNDSTPVPYNGTSPQSLPPPYSFVSGCPSEGNSRDHLTLALSTTSTPPKDDDEVDVDDFGAGPLGESKTVQIKP